MKKEQSTEQTKQKKNKKAQQIVPEEKIRNVQINKNQYFALYISILTIACTILFVAVVFMMTHIHVWWVWILDLCLLGFCVWRSVDQCQKVEEQQIYTIHSNCIVIKSLMLDTIVPLDSVCDVTINKTLFNKINKSKSHSIAIWLDEKHKHKVVIGFISEDLEQLSNEIMRLAENCKSTVQSTENAK